MYVVFIVINSAFVILAREPLISNCFAVLALPCNSKVKDIFFALEICESTVLYTFKIGHVGSSFPRE